MQKCSFIAIVGAPNAGKSTLVNYLVGSKVSIVSPKVQTTRVSVKGICNLGESQLVFTDTPGIFKPKRSLEKAIVDNALSRLSESDKICLVIDAMKGICAETEIILSNLKNNKKPVILVLNKVDKITPEKLLPLTQNICESFDFEKVFMISALKGSGVNDIKKYLADTAPNAPWMFPEDQMSDAPIRFLAAEITREKLFLLLQHELPYSISVETEKWEETDNKVNIHQVIYVAKEAHKTIIIGKSGATIKDVGIKSRKELAKILEKKVNLFLFVKVKENWIENPSLYRDMGVSFE